MKKVCHQMDENTMTSEQEHACYTFERRVRSNKNQSLKVNTILWISKLEFVSNTFFEKILDSQAQKLQALWSEKSVPNEVGRKIGLLRVLLYKNGTFLK